MTCVEILKLHSGRRIFFVKGVDLKVNGCEKCLLIGLIYLMRSQDLDQDQLIRYTANDCDAAFQCLVCGTRYLLKK